MVNIIIEFIALAKKGSNTVDNFIEIIEKCTFSQHLASIQQMNDLPKFFAK